MGKHIVTSMTHRTDHTATGRSNDMVIFQGLVVNGRRQAQRPVCLHPLSDLQTKVSLSRCQEWGWQRDRPHSSGRTICGVTAMFCILNTHTTAYAHPNPSTSHLKRAHCISYKPRANKPPCKKTIRGNGWASRYKESDQGLARLKLVMAHWGPARLLPTSQSL